MVSNQPQQLAIQEWYQTVQPQQLAIQEWYQTSLSNWPNSQIMD
jgi:hypothetical protein